MLQPVGPLDPGIYWRRRAMALACVFLALVTVYLMWPWRGSDAAPASAPVVPQSSSAGVAPPSSSAASKPAPKSSRPAPPKSTAPVVPACAVGALRIEAVASARTYKVGAEPVLSVRVTNPAAKPCRQDLGDPQIELQVYNGAARVWGSHDCKVVPGADPQTLRPNVPAVRSIQWSGLTSQPGCAGDRHRAGVGTYTLYALLSGQKGTAIQFAIT